MNQFILYFTVRLNWKIVRVAAGGGLLLLGAGCSGINASQERLARSTFSPARASAAGRTRRPTHPDQHALPLTAPDTEAANPETNPCDSRSR